MGGTGRSWSRIPPLFLRESSVPYYRHCYLKNRFLSQSPIWPVPGVQIFQRRFWTTHVNRKRAFFSFDRPWRHHIGIAKCLYSYRDDLPKNLFKITAQGGKKKQLPVDVRRSKKLLLKRPIGDGTKRGKQETQRGEQIWVNPAYWVAV